MTLAYLFGEIAIDGAIDVWPDNRDDVVFLSFLTEWFPPTHNIWRFIVRQ